ncbi:MAG: protoporphyrinogen oxidase, partial [Acidobacteriota bacterium]
GLEDLVRGLVQRLPPGTLRCRHRVRRVRPVASRRWQVVTDQGEETFDGLIIAVPAPFAAELLRPVDTPLGEALAGIPYGAAATVNLGFSESAVPHALDGFGFVVPSKEGLAVLGCTFAHRKYPGRAPAGHALLRGFHGNGTAALSDADLLDATRRDLRRLLGITADPVLSAVARYPLSLPHYTVGHLERVDRIDDRVRGVPGLALAGNAYRGVGVPDCVRSGEAAADALAGMMA